jgi:hypothetical protein
MTPAYAKEPPEGKSRPAVITMCVLTLRLMENWRAVVQHTIDEVVDADTALIVMAVVAIGAEKFTRGELSPELHSLAQTMPQGQLAKCNLRSIASATGIHRETVRRKVSKLQLSGILFADPVDGIRVTPSFAAREEVSRVVESQVDALARATSLLRAAGVFDVP